MVRNSRLSGMLVVTGFVFACTGMALAQQEKPKHESMQQGDQHQQHSQADKHQKQHEFKTCRASTLIGSNVKNYADKDIGEIQDLALDADSGRIIYAVLSFGGFMNMGEDWFAIPIQAFSTRTDGTVVLNVPKEKFENAKGFDKDHWPNMADKKWAEATHTAYGYPPYWKDETWVREMKERRQGSDSGALRIVRASDVVGHNVKNNADESLGNVSELVLDRSSSRVSYAVLSIGGFLGMGDKLFGVPWSTLTVQPQKDSTDVQSITLAIDKARLEKAPTFNESEWPKDNDKTYVVTIYDYYHIEPYWAADTRGASKSDKGK